MFRGMLLSVVVALCLSTAVSAAPLGPGDALSIRDGEFYTAAGARVGIWGVDLFQSGMFWGRNQDPAEYRPQIDRIAAAGFNAVRMPLNMAWFEPAKGVFPDSADYDGIMKAHGLPAGAVAFYDGLVKYAGEHGLYVIPEFHELPADPYRYFVGGNPADEKAGKPGTAIAWMAARGEDGRYHLDEALARTEVPRALGWMARHWRGVPSIAAIEVPWNEPGGAVTRGAAYTELLAACADAVKAADPDRLVFMDTVDWGAMVNAIPDESVWALPKGIDALFPHFYPGMHSGNSGEAGTWSTSMANWASWLAGSGKPVLVGEYGTVEMRRAGYWKDAVSDQQKATTYSACAAQWYAQGVQGAFAWAWQGGFQLDEKAGRLSDGAYVLPLWAGAYEHPSGPPLGRARLAVLCTRSQRAAYGSQHDLWKVSEALLGAHLTPFATIFDTQGAADPSALSRFDALIVLKEGLPDAAMEAARKAGKPLYELPADLAGLDEAIGKIEGLPGFGKSELPPNVIVAAAPGQVTVFERKGRAGKVLILTAIPGADGSGSLVADDGAVAYTGGTAALAKDGFTLDLKPYECIRLTWKPR
jgi:hypothetical protein